MHPYIPHLLSDIAAAHKNERIKKIKIESLEDIAIALNRLEEAHPFGYWCGLSAEIFPPPEQLLVKDVKIVNSAFRKMMKSWNTACHLPKGLPPKIVYAFLIRCLERNYDPAMGMSVTWSYCGADEANCELGKYCSCATSERGEETGGGGFIELKFEG